MTATNDTGLLFHITIQKPDGTRIGMSRHCIDHIEAVSIAQKTEGLANRIEVRPAIETSRVHGKRRYPNELHPQATPEAWEGWFAARDEAAQRARLIEATRRDWNIEL